VPSRTIRLLFAVNRLTLACQDSDSLGVAVPVHGYGRRPGEGSRPLGEARRGAQRSLTNAPDDPAESMHASSAITERRHPGKVEEERSNSFFFNHFASVPPAGTRVEPMELLGSSGSSEVPSRPNAKPLHFRPYSNWFHSIRLSGKTSWSRDLADAGARLVLVQGTQSRADAGRTLAIGRRTCER
jgi:hypothetical protein